jgi:hypothetical protein
MDEIKLAISIESSYKEKVEALAQVEHRTLTDQAAYLMEKGLLILERQQAQAEDIQRRICAGAEGNANSD